jgi:vancomycin resistance protein YoaR
MVMGGLAGVFLLAGAALVGLRLARPGALPGVEVAALDVGGLDDDRLAATLADYASAREQAQVTVTHDGEQTRASARDAGYGFDAQATADAVLERGRQNNPFVAFADHIRAFGSPIEVDPVERVDADALAAWAEDAADVLSEPPVEGDITFEGGEVIRTDPEPGAVVQADPLQARLHRALLTNEDAGEIRISAVAEPTDPTTTTADLDAIADDAERAVSGPVTLTRDDAGLTLSPTQIGEVLSVQRRGAATPETPGDGPPADGTNFEIVADVDAFIDTVSDADLAEVEQEPVDAEISLTDAGPSITPSEDGFEVDRAGAAEQVRELALGSGSREAELAGEVTAANRTTEDVEALGIDEQVSSFTTEFQAGQGRVTNIQRIADLVDGALIEPGETFSVNAHVGPRTEEKGFVEGGAIFDGEFVDEVGGGVSQFATTIYNAAYFGGYAIPEYQPHSYYISRYPAGREATLNYPNIDVKIHNNSPYGAMIDTSHTDTSVTVTIWGTEWVDVDSVSGERTNTTSPETETRETSDLPAGEERVVQSGRDGFDITVTRVLTFPDGRVEREEEFTRYQAEPRIVERGTG